VSLRRLYNTEPSGAAGVEVSGPAVFLGAIEVAQGDAGFVLMVDVHATAALGDGVVEGLARTNVVTGEWIRRADVTRFAQAEAAGRSRRHSTAPPVGRWASRRAGRTAALLRKRVSPGRRYSPRSEKARCSAR
jgi:hypothetical protein